MLNRTESYSITTSTNTQNMEAKEIAQKILEVIDQNGEIVIAILVVVAIVAFLLPYPNEIADNRKKTTSTNHFRRQQGLIGRRVKK